MIQWSFLVHADHFEFKALWSRSDHNHIILYVCTLLPGVLWQYNKYTAEHTHAHVFVCVKHSAFVFLFMLCHTMFCFRFPFLFCIVAVLYRFVLIYCNCGLFSPSKCRIFICFCFRNHFTLETNTPPSPKSTIVKLISISFPAQRVYYYLYLFIQHSICLY